jgi:hypothetical protein
MIGEHSDYLVFVDESGDHGLTTIDPAYSVFVLAFCIVQKTCYARQISPALTEFKFRHFGHDQVVLHERAIRKDMGDFATLREKSKKENFLNELTELIASFDMTIIATAIHKQRLIGQYKFPNNPYEMALGFGLERVQKWLSRQPASAGRTTVILECRGRREDDELELEFRRICAGGNFEGKTYSLEPRFVPKSANVPGLQIADLIARPIGRHILDPHQANRAYDVIERKLDRSPKGEVRGWGLKVFP